jgi:signal transduction histidine kinase
VDLGLAAALTESTLPIRQMPVIRIAPETLVPRLGDLLIERGLLQPHDLNTALDFQQEKISNGIPCLIGQALVELGFIDQYSIDEVVTLQIFQLQQNLEQNNRDLERRVEDRTAELQRALSKLTEIDQLKTNFISNISHELRTPLTHIKGYLDILSDLSLGPLTPLQIDAVNVILRSEERLEQLIDDLIQFSLAVRGELSLRLDPIDIAQLLEYVLNQTRKKANAKNHTIVIDSQDNLPKIIADEEKISWVIVQLVDNAIKFTPEGGEIRIAIDHFGESVELSISDNGIGIPEERIPEIFEPFHQLDGSVTRRYSGTGLGLAMVLSILEAHRSSISVDSKVGLGTSIKFFLPVTDDDGNG